jgi:alpha-galactosidase
VVLSAEQGWGLFNVGRSVDGNPLRVAGRTYETGYGTHAVSTIMVGLRKGTRRFTGACGLDDEAGPKSPASVRFRILDPRGKELFSTPVLRPGHALMTFYVDVTGIESLTLKVDDAGDGNISDHADWVDLRAVP